MAHGPTPRAFAFLARPRAGHTPRQRRGVRTRATATNPPNPHPAPTPEPRDRSNDNSHTLPAAPKRPRGGGAPRMRRRTTAPRPTPLDGRRHDFHRPARCYVPRRPARYPRRNYTRAASPPGKEGAASADTSTGTTRQIRLTDNANRATRARTHSKSTCQKTNPGQSRPPLNGCKQPHAGPAPAGPRPPPSTGAITRNANLLPTLALGARNNPALDIGARGTPCPQSSSADPPRGDMVDILRTTATHSDPSNSVVRKLPRDCSSPPPSDSALPLG